MAVFDAVEQRIYIRVVYDGAAGAGKTTNVRQLGSLFAAQRTREYRTPAELRGRTLFFDWLQISAGAVGGFPLLCQVLSVPGQAAFSARRRHLLESADVVVVICDSSLEKLDGLRHGLAWADAQQATTGLPLSVIVQANKQDQLDAVDGKTLLHAVGREELEAVEAIASEGIGVVDTFVAAVRSAARILKSRLDDGGLDLLVRRVEDEHELLSRLTSVAIDKYGAAEMLLEEVNTELLLLGGRASAAAIPAAERVLAAVAEEAAPSARVEPAVVEDAVVHVAPLPRADAPTGCVWPAHTGRAMLTSLGLSEDAVVGSSGVRRVVRDHVFTTSIASRYLDADAARHALVRAARERTQLDALLVSDTVLVAQPAVDGASWLWMISPCIDSIPDWLAADARPRSEALGAALADAAVVSIRHRLALCPSIHEFGAQNGRIRYAGSLSSAASDGGVVVALDLLVGSAEDVATLGHDVEPFIDAVTRRLRSRLTSDELALLAQESATRAASDGSVRARLVSALARFKAAA